MVELDKRDVPRNQYRELFDVEIDSRKCTADLVALTREGQLLYVKERLANQGNAYYTEQQFFAITKEEYHTYLQKALTNGLLEKAIAKERTTMEELEALGK